MSYTSRSRSLGQVAGHSALGMAIEARKPIASTLIHSDDGWRDTTSLEETAL